MPADTSKPALSSVGKYDLLAKVAEGGMGAVYRGRNRETGQIVAVKVVAEHMLGNQVILKRFEQEYNAASQLNHPNIVRAMDYGTEGSTPFLVMEFVEGESLGQKLQREKSLSEREAVRLIGQIAQALHRAHKERLIHRDVKPDNILVTPDGTAKLADLGLVKEVEADLNLTRTGRGLGTPHFMAPEQFKNAKNVDPRCDIYSLGATLYMMVTGEMPFHSSGPLEAYMRKIDNKITPPRELVPALSERIDWAIRRSMSADPDQRPESCREFVEDLTGRSTRKVTASEAAGSGQQEVWYLVYKDEEGTTHTLKGNKAGICRSLKEGLLGDASNVRASRTKEGPFEPLRSFPEFRQLVVSPAPLNPPTPTRSAPVQPAPAQRGKRPATPPEETPTVEKKAEAPPKSARVPHIAIATKKQSARKSWPLWLQVLLLVTIMVVSLTVGLFYFIRR
jgi:serine/threonine protein kinase